MDWRAPGPVSAKIAKQPDPPRATGRVRMLQKLALFRERPS